MRKITTEYAIDIPSRYIVPPLFGHGTTTQQESRLLKQTLFAGGSRFLYQSVTDELRSRITACTYPRGVRIPSVDELATEFGVSSITIRRAIRDLSLERFQTGRRPFKAAVL